MGKSAVVEKSLDPEWEEGEFEVPDECQTKGGEVIVSLFDQDKLSKDEVQAAPVTIKYPFRKADYTLETQGTLTVVSDYGSLISVAAEAGGWVSSCINSTKNKTTERTAALKTKAAAH